MMLKFEWKEVSFRDMIEYLQEADTGSPVRIWVRNLEPNEVLYPDMRVGVFLDDGSAVAVQSNVKGGHLIDGYDRPSFWIGTPQC